MTNREAIEVLQRNADFCDAELEDAINLAISALEKQEQAENEWCPDCAEYGKERHCCHRFTKVIRQTVEECKREWANEGWILVTERLPEYGTAVLTQLSDNDIVVNWVTDEEDEEWFEYGVVAWKPLPEPYTEEEA